MKTADFSISHILKTGIQERSHQNATTAAWCVVFFYLKTYNESADVMDLFFAFALKTHRGTHRQINYLATALCVLRNAKLNVMLQNERNTVT